MELHNKPSHEAANPAFVKSEILEALEEASAKEIIALLFRFELAEAFLRQLKERAVVFNAPGLSQASDIQSAAIERYCQYHQLQTPEAIQQWCAVHGMKEKDLTSEAIHAWRRSEQREKLLEASGETLYLRYKDKIDRVLYSLIRVKDPGLCQELFYAIEAKEITFGEAARRHSHGPEAKTQGLVGPVDLVTPHPEIASRLRSAQPGQLLEPFEADEWHTIIRLEYRFDSEYDDNTQEFLRELAFKGQVTAGIETDIEQLVTWLWRGEA
ncbi:peptidylprolyl isomerase [Synechococcus sp. FGCU-3]|nr:peptidylprolyl isomerase [Synechococcus sp. FGCU3]